MRTLDSIATPCSVNVMERYLMRLEGQDAGKGKAVLLMSCKADRMRRNKK